MKWSFRIAKLFGIEIRVHLTFALIVAVFAGAFGRHHGSSGMLFGVALVSCLFACVVLHELGHSLVAQAFGISVREILLLPIGGVARLGREPERPFQELLIALAGPLVNVLIAAVLLAIAILTFGSNWLLEGGLLDGRSEPSWSALLAWLLTGNISVAIFNMIPALPMDGGRVFRALLAMLLGKGRATNIAAAVGQVLAAVIAVLGIHKQESLLTLIGVFVFLAAAQERAASQTGEALSALRAADAVSLNTIVLGPGDLLGPVVRYLLRSEQSHFPVVHGERLIGVLSREDVLREVSRTGSAGYVAGLVERRVLEVDANTPLDQVRAKIMENDGRPVVVRGIQGYLGLLSFEDVSRVARVATRLQRSKVLRPGERSRASLS